MTKSITTFFTRYVPYVLLTIALALYASEACPQGTGREAVLVHNGRSSAVIVTAPKPCPVIRAAAQELQLHIKKATGAHIPISSRPAAGRGKLALYVGESAATRALGHDTAALAFEEFIIDIAAERIMLLGRDNPEAQPFTHSRKNFCREAGTLLAVYTFLRDYLDIRWYFPGPLGEVIPQQHSISLAPAVRKLQPAFSPRETQLECGPGLEVVDADWPLWARRTRHGGFHSYFGHSFGNVIGPDYVISHPEYFAVDKSGQRTFHARGRQNVQLCLSQPGLVDVFVDAARTYFKASPSNRCFTVMPGDKLRRDTGCQCPACSAQYDYGFGVDEKMQQSRYVWGFVNKVAAALKDEYPNRLIVCCAYGGYRYPWPGMRFEPNIAIGITVNRVGFGYNVGWAMSNARQWLGTVDHIFIDENYHNGTMGKWQGAPFVCPRRIASEIGTRRGSIRGEPYDVEFIPQLPDPVSGRLRKHYRGWMMDNLNLYVISELNFDASLDVELIIDRYCCDLYGPAAAEVKTLYGLLEKQWNASPAGLGVTGYGQVHAKYKNRMFETCWQKVYPPEFVTTVFHHLEKARQSIAPSDDPVFMQRLMLLERGLQPMQDNMLRILTAH